MTALTVTDKSEQATTSDNTSIGNFLQGLYDRGGQIKAKRVTYVNDTGSALADGSIVKLTTVGPCLILPTSVFTFSAFGAARTLDMGVQEYKKASDGTTVSSDIDALLDGLDVSSAVTNKVVGTDTASLTGGDGLLIYGQADILAKVIGGTLPVDGTIEGFIFYISS